MFETCNTITEVILESRRLKAQGVDIELINRGATERRQELAKISINYPLLPRQDIGAKMLDIDISVLSHRIEHLNQPLIEISGSGEIIL